MIWSEPKVDDSVPVVPEWQYYSQEPVRPRRRPGADARASPRRWRRLNRATRGRARGQWRRPRAAAATPATRWPVTSRAASSRARHLAGASVDLGPADYDVKPLTDAEAHAWLCAHPTASARAPTAARSPRRPRATRTADPRAPRARRRTDGRRGRARPPRVDEHGLLARRDLAARDRRGEPGHRLGGVDRVEHEPFAAAGVVDGAGRGVGQLLVARADLVEVDPQAVGVARSARRSLAGSSTAPVCTPRTRSAPRPATRPAIVPPDPTADDHVADVGRVLEDLLART